jgi:hypothetical protein
MSEVIIRGIYNVVLHLVQRWRRSGYPAVFMSAPCYVLSAKFARYGGKTENAREDFSRLLIESKSRRDSQRNMKKPA